MTAARNLKPASRPIRAAQYVRMSTEDQRYSIENQSDAISNYASDRGIEIVRTYADVAKSGLSLKGRPALTQLLQDTISGSADFDLILVYDLSRWGRFQDADESAHYEFLCSQAGVPIKYCAEQLEQDGIPSGLLKTLKRAMAAEYSRELSVKTFASLCKVARQGFSPGGMAPYGIRRMLISESGVPTTELLFGQRKNLRSERVAFVPGPKHELDTVRRIFWLFVEKRQSLTKIMQLLNDEEVPIYPNNVWRLARITAILKTELYLGNIVYGRRSLKLGAKKCWNAPETWVRGKHVFEPVVPPDQFEAAQRLLADQARKLTDYSLLEKLSALHRKAGKLSQKIINQSADLPWASTYRERFGSLYNAYALIGISHLRRLGSAGESSNGSARGKKIRADIFDQIEATGVHAVCKQNCRLIEINNQYVIRVYVAPAQRFQSRYDRWIVRCRCADHYDALLAIRLTTSNDAVLDYFLLPNLRVPCGQIFVGTTVRSRYKEFHTYSVQPVLDLCRSICDGHSGPRTSEEFEAFLRHS